MYLVISDRNINRVLERAREQANKYLRDKKTPILKINIKKDDDILQMQKLYWTWIDEISERTGNDKDYLHAFFKNKFLAKRVHRSKKGTTIEEIGTTTNLSRKEFNKYMCEIQAFIGDFGFELKNNNTDILNFKNGIHE